VPYIGLYQLNQDIDRLGKRGHAFCRSIGGYVARPTTLKYDPPLATTSARTIQTVAILSILCLGACRGSSGDDAPASPPAERSRSADSGESRANVTAIAASATPIPKGSWTDLARRLVDSKNLTTAVTVTRDVLARGGVATSDGDRVLVQAAAPAASFQSTPTETIRLAMEARRRPSAARLTAAELAQMLEGFGWPFPGGREGGGPADREPRGRVAEPEKLQEAEQKERQAQQAAESGSDEAIEAERQAGRARVEAAQRLVMEATNAYQRARQGVAKAPASGKAAAEAELKDATAARMAAIEQLGVVRKNESEAERERRARSRIPSRYHTAPHRARLRRGRAADGDAGALGAERRAGPERSAKLHAALPR